MNDGKVTVTVSDDGMKAFADITPPGVMGNAVSVDDLLEALKRKGVEYGIFDTARLATSLKNTRGRKATFIVATGKYPGRGDDAYLNPIWKEKSARSPVQDHEKVDLRELDIVYSVKPGEIIAEKVSPTYGANGVTVYGEIVTGRPGRDKFFKAGANVKVNNKNTVYFSTINGVPVINGNTICVSPTFEVDGNVDYSVGNIVFAGTVIIRGDVRDGFTVKAQGDVFVGGHVESAKIIAGGDVRVGGGIITRYAGFVAAEGSVYAKHITNSIVEAEGDVISYREIVNSFVRSNGSVRCVCSDGRITGGDIMARNEIQAMQLGSTTETSTVLRAGFNFKNYLVVGELEQRLIQITATLKDAGRYINGNGAMGSEAAIRMEESIPALKREKVILSREIKALSAAAPVNPDASVKCENEARAGVVVFIGENSKRISWPMRNIEIRLDEDLRVKVGILHSRRKKAEDTELYPGFSAGDFSPLRTSGGGSSAGILVFDPSDLSRDRLKEILLSGKFELVGDARHSYDAVRLYKKYLPEIVIVDVSASNHEGLQAVRDIYEADKDAVLVISIGVCDMDILREAIGLGASHFILKPYYRKNVADAIFRALDGRKQVEEGAG